MATHSSNLAWKIPWTEETGGLQSMGSQRTRHNWATEHTGNSVILTPRLSFLLLETATASHSSTPAWKTPWMEEPGRLQPMGSLRLGHDWETSLSLFTFMHWRRKWQPIPVSYLENPRDRGAWWAAIYGVAQRRTRLKRLSSKISKVRIFSPLSLKGRNLDLIS